MEKNIGAVDKVIRIIVALVSAYLGWKISPWFYIITVVALVTAALGWCGLYSFLKISTVKK